MWRAGWRFATVPGEPLLQWRDSPDRLSRTDPRYDSKRFRECKFHYFSGSSFLPPGRRLLQWGAGHEGKAWLKMWRDPVRPELVVDVDPRKIGKHIHGVRVVAPEDLGPPGDALLVVAVAALGARDDIRSRLVPRGWVEGVHFIFLA
jgi:hypothetical protein